MKTSPQLRLAFLDFFARRGHALRPSAPLIPPGDPTLMFNSAGMVPFKPYFLGLKKDLSRAASCQKCLRTTDIDRVGTTLRHLTFFEMLGNFSFGDYFKEEAIAWAWEFLTREMGLDPKRLTPTVFQEDTEAEALWRKHPIQNPVVRLGEDSNFWAAGPTGPCGPCSEIYFDRGPEHSCGQASCSPGCDCDRFLEIWNLVFMQSERLPDGALKPLPRQNIDTGMGLERLAFVAQGKAEPFDTDLFEPVAGLAREILGNNGERTDALLALRVIEDHARAAAMLCAEGIIPSNVDRGYVLRRLIRRAARYGQLLGARGAFLHRLVGPVGQVFPEIKPSEPHIRDILKNEEEKFLETLEVGEKELRQMILRTGAVLSGEQAFKLYDTFGFPLELTKEICAKAGLAVDEPGFQKASERASDLARASWKGSGERDLLTERSLEVQGRTHPLYYDCLESEAQVIALFFAGDRMSGAVSEEQALILDQTPFYPEGGGQVGDEGEIFSANRKTLLAKVLNTQRSGGVILHRIRFVRKGASLKAGERVYAKVDAVRRNYITPHHTGTHLLNEALRRVLGQHVRQAGSYVGADKLRFDFTHPKALDPETLRKVSGLVASEIQKGERVETRVDSIEKVKEYGAVTLPGEDYGEKPRFVLIGPKGWQDPKDRFSLELCGGTHCASTAELVAFKIVRDSSVAAGIRRIEAVAGKAVEDYQRQKDEEDRRTVAQILLRERELLEEVDALGGEARESPPSSTEPQLRLRERELRELIGRLRSRKIAAQAQSGRRLLEVSGLKLCAQRLEGADPKALRGLSDKLKAEMGSGLVFLATPKQGKLSFILAATPDLPPRGVDAARIAKAFAAAHGGSAGGRADFAQGGLADSDWDGLVQDLAARLS